MRVFLDKHYPLGLILQQQGYSICQHGIVLDVVGIMRVS